MKGQRTAPRRRLWREIGEGPVWQLHQPLVRFIAFLTGMFNLTSAGFILIVIKLVEPMHATPLSSGLIFTIGGVGGILGAIVASPLQKRLRFGVVIISTSCLWAVLWFAYLFAPDIQAIGIITAVSFVLNSIYNVTQLSYRLALIPDRLQGRVNSVFRLLAFGGQPIGFALTGVMLDQFGPYYTLTGIGAIQALMALITILNKHVRHAKPIKELPPPSRRVRSSSGSASSGSAHPLGQRVILICRKRLSYPRTSRPLEFAYAGTAVPRARPTM